MNITREERLPFDYSELQMESIMRRAIYVFDSFHVNHLKNVLEFTADYDYSDYLDDGAYRVLQITYFPEVYGLLSTEQTLRAHSGINFIDDNSRKSAYHRKALHTMVHLLLYERAKMLKQPYQEAEDLFVLLNTSHDGSDEVQRIKDAMFLDMDMYFQTTETYKKCKLFLENQQRFLTTVKPHARL